MTQPIGERVASLETSVNEFHHVTGASLQRLTAGQDRAVTVALAASTAAEIAVVEAQAARAEIAHVGETTTAAIAEVKGATDAIKYRLDDLSLNGSGAELKQFFHEDVPVLHEFAGVLNDKAAVKRRRDASHWWWVAGWALKLAVPAAAGSALYALISALLH